VPSARSCFRRSWLGSFFVVSKDQSRFFVVSKYQSCFYVDGEAHGEFKQYNTEGKLQFTHIYINGKSFHEKNIGDNLLNVTLTIVDHEVHAKHKIYHSNGQLKSIGFFKNNLMHGRYKTYDENGVIIQVSNYDNGNCVDPLILHECD
jgi:antitoxin component YwqK of YwqJK toxin-antitoxin module